MVPDLILAVAAAVLGISMIPAVVKRTSMPLATTLPTAISLTAIVGAYAALALWFAAAVTTLNTACWWLLVFRR